MQLNTDKHPEFPVLLTHQTEVGGEVERIGRFASVRHGELYIRRSDRFGKPDVADAAIADEVERRVAAERAEIFTQTAADLEKQLIIATVNRCGGNREAAAKSLGIGIRTLSGKLRQYGWARRQKAG